MCLPSFFTGNNFFLYFLSVTFLRVSLNRFSIIKVIKINVTIPSTTLIFHASLAFGISVVLICRAGYVAYKFQSVTCVVHIYQVII
jgi:hypothetical protein